MSRMTKKMKNKRHAQIRAHQIVVSTIGIVNNAPPDVKKELWKIQRQLQKNINRWKLALREGKETPSPEGRDE